MLAERSSRMQKWGRSCRISATSDLLPRPHFGYAQGMAKRARRWSFPPEVDVLGHIYRIERRPYKRMTGFWLCSHKGKRIRIASRIGLETAKKTLLHEILHAAAFHKGIHLSEHMVRELEDGVDGMLRDNPWIAQLYVPGLDRKHQGVVNRSGLRKAARTSTRKRRRKCCPTGCAG